MATTTLTPEQLTPWVEDLVGELGHAPLFEYVLGTLLGEVQDDAAEWFSSETAPSGEKWAALAASTVKAKGHSKILFETGALRDSLVSLTSDSIRDFGSRNEESAFAVWGTGVEYAHFHQDGTTKMPQREMVGITDDRLEWLGNEILDELENQWRKA